MSTWFNGLRRLLLGCMSCLLTLTMFTGCIEVVPKDISVLLNGNVLSSSSDTIKLKEGKLYASAALLEQILGVDIDAGVQSLSENVFYQDQVAVLMYHHLDPNPSDLAVLYLKSFEKQMELLKNSGFHVISMDDYVRYMTQGASVPDNAVLLTFDDGYESFYTYAYPILLKYGYTATNFVIVSAVDHQSGISKLTWDQMREMKQAGMSFYSHTYNSHQYAVMNEDGKKRPLLVSKRYVQKESRIETEAEYKQRVQSDLSYAEERLKKELGNTRGIVAFPYGASNSTVHEVLKELGVELTFTIKPGLNTRENKNAYRYNAGGDEAAPKDIIVSLKQLGESDALYRVKVNGEAIAFNKDKPYVVDQEVMLPLREMCDRYDVELTWDSKRQTIKLMKSI